MDSVDYVAQAYSQAPWRKQLQLIVGFLLGLVTVAVVAAIYLSVSARSVALGHEIQDLRDTILETERNIANLESQLASLTARSVMEQRADEWGFEPVDQEEILFIVVPEYTGRPVAALASPPGPTIVRSPVQSPVYTESLIDWLKENVFSPVRLISEVGR